MKITVSRLIAICAIALLARELHAAPSDFDVTFGTNGRAHFGLGISDSYIQTLLVQPDGRILAGGYASNATNYFFALARYEANGTFDNSFGAKGRVTTAFSGFDQLIQNGLAMQADGKILAAGRSYGPGMSPRFAVARYLPDGSLDPTFGTNGKVTSSVATLTAFTVAPQPDGRILVGGSSEAPGPSGAFIARLNADGSLDTSFGTGGYLISPEYGYTTSLIALADGRIIAAGWAGSLPGKSFITRLSASGVRDDTFGSNGVAPLPVPMSIAGLTILQDGKIVAGGSGVDTAASAGFVLVQLTEAGQLDPVFDGDGVATATFGVTGTFSAHGFARASDGRMYIAGSRRDPSGNFTAVLARFATDGSPDPTFGSGGLATDPSPVTYFGLAVQGDGRAVAGLGTSGLIDAIVRYDAGGGRDAGFGTAGLSDFVFEAGRFSETNVEAFAAAPDGKLYAMSGGMHIQRLTAGGTPDASYGAGGKSTLAATNIAGEALAVFADGSTIAVGATSASPPSMVLVKRDGVGDLVSSFGAGGILTVPPAGTSEAGTAVAPLPDGRFVVAADSYVGANRRLMLARFLADGSLDSSFGSAGRAYAPIPFGIYASVAILADGRILARAGCNVARFSAEGMLDSGFGAAGVAQLVGSELRCTGMAVQPDGKIVLGGEGAALSYGHTLFAGRLDTAGVQDASFGNNGLAAIIGGSNDLGEAVAVDEGGRILVGGGRPAPGGGYALAIARFMPNGATDLSFGNRGLATYQLSGVLQLVQGIVIRPDGRIVMGVRAGGPEGPLGVVRLLGGAGLPTPPASDFDGDTRSDLLWSNVDGRVAIWRMDGLTPTATQEILGTATGWSVAAIADFDGDGKSDLAWQHSDGRVAVYLMNGTTPTATQQLLNAGPWTVKHTPDLNGDGKADLLFENADGSVAVWTMNGTTMTGGATIIGPGTGWSVIRTADFDGDGKDDLLWRHTDGRHAIWLMNGINVSSSVQILNAGNWTATHTPDLNGDGKADIVWQNTEGTIAAWLMNGSAMSSGATLLSAPTGWTVTRTGDFNGDGKADLFFMHSDGRAAIYLMNGLAAIQTTQILNGGGGWSAKRLLDLDGDGKADIVWENVDGRVAVWIMSGTSMYSGTGILGPGTGWSVSPVSQ